MAPCMTIAITNTMPGDRAPTSGGRGMQLGRKNNSAAIIDNIKAEEGIEDVVVPSRSMSSAPGARNPTAVTATEGIHVMIEERLAVTCNRDGGLQNMEVKGEMLVSITDEAKQHIKLNLSLNHNGNVQFKVSKGLKLQIVCEAIHTRADECLPVAP